MGCNFGKDGGVREEKQGLVTKESEAQPASGALPLAPAAAGYCAAEVPAAVPGAVVTDVPPVAAASLKTPEAAVSTAIGTKTPGAFKTNDRVIINGTVGLINSGPDE